MSATDPAHHLVDRLEVLGTCTRMAWLADRRDWDGLLAVFDDEVDVDYTSLTGGDPARLPRHELVQGWAAGLSGLAATQHLLGNQLATLDGDTAEATAAFQATHVLPNPHGAPTWTLGGHYHYRLRRTTDGWRITAVAMTTDWATGNQHIMTLAAARAR